MQVDAGICWLPPPGRVWTAKQKFKLSHGGDAAIPDAPFKSAWMPSCLIDKTLHISKRIICTIGSVTAFPGNAPAESDSARGESMAESPGISDAFQCSNESIDRIPGDFGQWIQQ